MKIDIIPEYEFITIQNSKQFPVAVAIECINNP